MEKSSVEDFPRAFLVFERRKEAGKFRTSYWGKHWGSQETWKEVGR